jgi:hypothetical protein
MSTHFAVASASMSVLPGWSGLLEPTLRPGGNRPPWCGGWAGGLEMSELQPIKTRHQRYYAENREKVRERQRRHYLANRDAMRELHRKYYAENRARELQRQHQFYVANREHILERKRARRI